VSDIFQFLKIFYEPSGHALVGFEDFCVFLLLGNPKRMALFLITMFLVMSSGSAVLTQTWVVSVGNLPADAFQSTGNQRPLLWGF
jgi:hypothetical protein